MADAEIAIKYVIDSEIIKKADGTIISFCDNPVDKGGPTNFGLSQKFLNLPENIKIISTAGLLIPSDFIFKKVREQKEWLEEDVKAINKSIAIVLYSVLLWKPIYAEIKSQTICNYFFDMVVNHGEKEATLLVQRIIKLSSSILLDNDVSAFNIKEDGIIGAETIMRINKFFPLYARGLKIMMQLVRAQLIHDIVSRDPSQRVFLDGWLKRCYR